MLKIVVCEDEKEQRELIKEYLKKILDETSLLYEILTFNSGEELLNNYSNDIDILLLDILMDKLSGMDTARKIREIDDKNVEIIFTTSLVDYIQEGYEVRAYRYLLKPLRYEDLKKHMISCINEIREKNKYILVDGKSESLRIKVSDITYIEIQKRDMTIHTIKGDYKLKSTMDKVEKDLDNHNFYRCHKSFLVNMEYVDNIKQYVAILENKDEVSISRHRFKDFKVEFLRSMGDKLC
ncbi:DNA-binding response regulator [Romboutsia weinsteinii]|uniref:Stage 0 sporulation protein A homolog n=1 Tax=Romboutsia weinsteinii TaxID=2020949 RepID=A0A255ING6_9FIRM|nr:LytTR family DNA-binding domain-containing protein [Romboutsia weinsteinii]RDY27741.1 DNA-binding response regulator [Romboutsia weinsteinii]